jgi:hypothetical protein
MKTLKEAEGDFVQIPSQMRNVANPCSCVPLLLMTLRSLLREIGSKTGLHFLRAGLLLSSWQLA